MLHINRRAFPCPRAALLLAPLLLTLVLACRGAADDGEASPPQPTVVAASAATSSTAAIAPTASSEPPAGTPPVEPTASTGGTARERLPRVEFLRRDGTAAVLPLEVPPQKEYGIGLSGRYALDERGMLFDFGLPAADRPFWMKNTHINLDIAFVAPDLRIVAIRAMQAESLQYVYGEEDYQFAIEAPAGWYAQHGVETGDRVRFTFDTPSALGQR